MTTIEDFSAEPAYEPRRFRTFDPWIFGARRFKVHAISHDVSKPPFADAPHILIAACRHAESLLPEMDREGNHFDLGYVVLHEGEDALNYWLLFDWWIAGGIACRILSRAGGADPLRYDRVVRPYSACVWEAVAVAHERDAWVRTILTGAPDRQAYLDARLADGCY